MRTKMRSRVHVVLVRVSEFHLWGKNMELIQLRRTPAFLILVDNEISVVAEIFIYPYIVEAPCIWLDYMRQGCRKRRHHKVAAALTR